MSSRALCIGMTAGSWDKTLKYWDCRTANPVFTYNLPERCYALDVKHPLLVVGTADRQLLVFNLQSPQQPYKSLQSPLKWQTRCLAAFPGKCSAHDNTGNWGGGLAVSLASHAGTQRHQAVTVMVKGIEQVGSSSI